MSFTTEEKQEFLALIIEGVETVTGPRFEALESDVAELKSDVAELKLDMRGVKSELTDIKHRLTNLETSFNKFDGRLRAVENDVKEIYKMLASKPISSFSTKAYSKLSNSDKLLEIHKEVRHLASLEGITLPQN
jgi:chromosome segregation ATPase